MAMIIGGSPLDTLKKVYSSPTKVIESTIESSAVGGTGVVLGGGSQTIVKGAKSVATNPKLLYAGAGLLAGTFLGNILTGGGGGKQKQSQKTTQEQEADVTPTQTTTSSSYQFSPTLTKTETNVRNITKNIIQQDIQSGSYGSIGDTSAYPYAPVESTPYITAPTQATTPIQYTPVAQGQQATQEQEAQQSGGGLDLLTLGLIAVVGYFLFKKK